MSHNLEVIGDKVQHVYSGDVPWHGLGKPVHHDLTPAQMMKEAGLDWSVKKISLSGKVGKQNVTFPRAKGLVRVSDDPKKNGTPLTIVGKGWEPIQNDEFVNFFHSFVMAGDLEMHTAGAIRDPNTDDFYTWMQAKIKGGVFEVVKGDVVESFVLFSNPFIYGKSANIRHTDTRVVCNNTLDAALFSKTKAEVKIGHRQVFDAEQVKQVLKINLDVMAKYKEAAQFLASKKAKWTKVEDYFRNVEPATTEKKREAKEMSSIAEMFVDAYAKQPGAQFGEGSWWQAFNATTYAYDHMVGRKYENDNDERANRLVKSWYGYGRINKVKSLELALDFAKAA